MDYIDINVPTKAYLKKYMESEYGNPITMTRGDKYGSLLLLMLEKNSREYDWNFQHCKSSMTIRLKTKWYHRKGTDFSKTNILYLNTIIEADFKMMMRTYVYAKLDHFPPQKKKDAILSFLTLWGVTHDEMPYETAKKDIDRYFTSISYS